MTVNFNDGLLPSNWPVIYEGLATNVLTGNIGGVSASPPNNTFAYLTVGPTRGATVTVRFQAMMDYFGFYVGSLDSYNFVDFYRGTDFIRTFSGTEIASIGGFPANGDQGRGIYVNVYADSASEHFDRVVLRSTSNAMESDNHTFRAVQRSVTTVSSPVPEPSTYLLIGLGLAAIARYRRPTH
ncbi:MAG: PEP-CTERM sorting domain-containing protein [Acidobacteria bacterium]|nr:PEP-CTERM sorting domain-containing protein [Acidobacteriota bacterium]